MKPSTADPKASTQEGILDCDTVLKVKFFYGCCAIVQATKATNIMKLPEEDNVVRSRSKLYRNVKCERGGMSWRLDD